MEYTKVSFPKELHTAVKKFIEEHPELGYRSPTEFIAEAVRLRLETLKFGTETQRYIILPLDQKSLQQPPR